MIRIHLLGMVALIRDEEMVEKLEPLFEDHLPDHIDDAAPWRQLRSDVPARMFDDYLPGFLEGVMKEVRALNERDLPANEIVVWGKNKVRAHPGPNYHDPRDPDEFTEFA